MKWLDCTSNNLIYVRSISNVLNSHKTNFMPCFSINKRSYTVSDRSHAHWIWLHSTTHGEVSRPPLLWIGNVNRTWIRLKSIVAAATIQIMKLVWVTYLGALSSINVILIPRISAHPPIMAQRKVHRPWALFREGTVCRYACLWGDTPFTCWTQKYAYMYACMFIGSYLATKVVIGNLHCWLWEGVGSS